MPESNFDFLADTDPDLHDMATSAEALLHDDPVACLGRLRGFAEQCTKTYVRDQSVPTHWEELTQFDRLERLEATNELSRTILNPLHKIRRAGNTAVHDNEGTLRDAKRQLRHAHAVAVWVHVNVYDCPRPRASFRMPSPTSSEEASPATSSSEPPVEQASHSEPDEPPNQQESHPNQQSYFPDPEPQGPGLGTRAWDGMKQAGGSVQNVAAQTAGGIQHGMQYAGRAAKQVTVRTGQGIRDAFAWIYSTICAFFAAVWRVICAVGRFVKRVVKWTVFAVAVGALVVYFPAVYATTTGWLPETTQQEIPAVEVVTETHAEWIPPETQAQVGTYAQTGAQAVQSGVYSMWTAAVAQGQRLWERRSEQTEAPDSD